MSPASHLFPTQLHKRLVVSAFSLFLIAAKADAASITIEWDPPTEAGVVGYVLSYYSPPGKHATRVILGPASRYEVTGLDEGTRYCFAVQAVTASGRKSKLSKEVCGSAGTVAPPAEVSTASELTAALAAAKPGATIYLKAGTTFVGNFVLPRRSDSTTEYVTIRSSAANSALPGEGVRMTPSYAAQLPKLRSPNSNPALSTEPGAHHYRLQFLEFLANADGEGDMITLGDGSAAQDSLDDVPSELILDRLLLRGDATMGQQRAIALNSASTTIVDSHVSDIKAAGAASQAIAGWNGPGPYLISNNYLEASGENIQFGAVPPSIPLLVPSNIALRRNHITKQLTWKRQSWKISTLLELKNATGVVVDGNVLENSWPGKGLGFAVQIHSANTIDMPAWSEVQDLLFTNNTVRNVFGGIYVAENLLITVRKVSGIAVRNNFFDRIIGSSSSSGGGIFVAVIGGADITIDHNTVANEGHYGLLGLTSRLVFTNNVMVEDGPSALPGLSSISEFFPDGRFAGGIYPGASKKEYPVNNFYPSTAKDIGFVNYHKRDYRLSKKSIYKNGATDGTDPGCDFVALALAQK